MRKSNKKNLFENKDKNDYIEIIFIFKSEHY